MRKQIVTVLLSLILCASVSIGLYEICDYSIYTYADTGQELTQEEGDESSDESLRITVVEDMPAEDLIVDENTPLAPGPGENGDCVMHAILMGAFLILTLGFSRYFLNYDRKLFDLRTRIAEAEQSVRLKERNQR